MMTGSTTYFDHTYFITNGGLLSTCEFGSFPAKSGMGKLGIWDYELCIENVLPMFRSVSPTN